MKNLKVLVFIVILIEIALFILVGKLIGLALTLLLVIASAVAGFALLKHNSRQMVKQMQQSSQTGFPPIFAMMAGTVRSLAAILLIIPGFLTDLIGLLILIPAVRPHILRRIPMPMSMPNVHTKASSTNTTQSNNVIDAEFEEDHKDSVEN